MDGRDKNLEKRAMSRFSDDMNAKGGAFQWLCFFKNHLGRVGVVRAGAQAT